MVRKKVEGDEEQRRAAGRTARRQGTSPSSRGVTTGGSKQRTHLTDRAAPSHDERLATRHRGKQRWEPAPAPPGPDRARSLFAGRGHPAYTDEHETVFRALAEAEEAHRGAGVPLDEVARYAGLPRERTRDLLHDLVVTHRLAAKVPDREPPDLGPLYEVRPR
ncbi:hypothetical protein [Streptomyces zingiberis]|uniref:DUF742 domain-containing protein n=1 Tax=Streptomyces zingiberis TaxID=2053010 RepID=A0ABX1BXW8_9ACTN|nr:hypothetical protein [Streptomyces zingiberis]NJQ00342.1 hypothetical protein [Streptomyces zingiberis]